MTPAPARRGRWRSTFLLVGLFWAVLYVALTIQSFLLHNAPVAKAAQRLATISVGACLCLAMAVILRTLARRPFWQRVSVAAALIFPAAMAYAVTNALVFGWVDEKLALHFRGAVIPAIVVNGLFWVPTFMCWSAIFLALEFSFDVGERERRIAELRVSGEQAQLLALRYQINPHFLFNAHNAVLSLIAQGEADRAAETLRHLSAFLRHTLEMDPVAPVTLDEEVALTRLYLKVEQVRFPTRLRLRVEVSPEAATVPAPGLILQPLVENAVKHGVQRSSARTTVSLIAVVEAGRLRIEVRNDGEGASPDAAVAAGLGVGLENVRARLALIYGADARLDAAPLAGGGFAARLDLPAA
ncbi:MAG: histidine kinase [Pseudomonadota bacterium]